MVSFHLPFTTFCCDFPVRNCIHTWPPSHSGLFLKEEVASFPRASKTPSNFPVYFVVNLTGPSNVGGETGKSCHNIQEAATVLAPHVGESWRFLHRAGGGMCDAPQRGVEVFAFWKHFSCSGARPVVGSLKCAVAPCKPSCPSGQSWPKCCSLE